MVKYEVKEIADKNVWESFLLAKIPKSFLQSWGWGEINRKTGEKIFRLGFFKGRKLVGTCLLIKQDAKRGPHLVVPGGPFLNWSDKALFTFFVNSLKDLAAREKVWFVRVRPELLNTPESINLFAKLGFKPAPMHLHAENTWVLDITKPEEEILRGMRKSTRYLVKKSFSEGLKVDISESKKYAGVLYNLQKETSERHGFVGFPQKLFEVEIEEFTKDDNARVFICRKGKKVLAVAIIIFYGDSAYYHLSGSTSEFPKIPFSYFLQWQIIREAKKRELKYYNFWGIAPNDSPRHRFSGVTLFKTGFGGERIDWMHAQDLPISTSYWLTYLFETARRIIRRL
ncbi:hypothetical protein A2210_00660 [Candidatus Woesebacteria bacterium RIFOXYA1_FULL_40_18]|uniref:BioF2-like acetyltransferase domain-containing protein n=1 Tax=Candidatus Woesebacteria bacterium RIFOXYA1_FULL_40_18 TaxID=1802532 RepID=A0A1F8CKL7_9BACT|nr:MAG: hypothetical protein A2210_00660 [Candidatus Woesebacteria bacterium RIFOXYA1_FULL_40_18]